MTPILAWAVRIALVLLLLAMALALGRLVRGPAAEDRILALDNLYLDAMLAMLVLGLAHRSSVYFEVALLVALLGFAGSTAMAKFLLRGEVIE